ncbi:MAG TPA: protein kinase, partial [Labilithrix sp.]|nr:protein kinase [Labilithrix sp.]
MRRVLGRGASGVVYHAVDRETGDEVALKTLVSPDAERIYHLKAEFRSLAQIAHPNLVQLEELIVGPDTCFFTMELLHGKTFGDYARALAGGGTSARSWTEPAITRLRRVSLQLASGIATLHEAGKLHRDIKPTNILVTDDDRAVLVDFGLCTALALVERMRSPFVGTLLYMAPEQAWGKPLSRAADWYALGAVLYEAIVGRLPFEAEGARLLFEKEKPPPVVDVAPGVLPLLQLAAALMDPLPERRPRPAAILAALAGADDAVPSSAHPSVPFVGRTEERAALDAALADVMAGRPAVVHVEGASGVGKSELVARFLASIERRPGTVILRGRCHSRESVSYNGFDGVIDELSEWLSSLDSSEIADVIPVDAGALLAIFPILGRIEVITPDPEVRRADAYTLRQQAFRALRELFTKIAERYTLVIALDDAQSGGADTASLLSDVFRPPNTPRVLLLLSYRSEEDSRSTMFEVLRERADTLLDSVHRVTVGPLPLTESCELAAELLKRDDVMGSTPLSDPEATRALASRVAEESGGHPLFLRELALSVAASPEVGTQDLGHLIRERIGRLSDAERMILELTSIASRPLSRRVLLAAAGSGERARPDVARLGRKRLVRETTVSGQLAVEPYHAKVRDAVLAAWPAEERQLRHRALADALLAEEEVDSDAVVDQLRGAGDLESAARWAVIAAARADAALAFDRAVYLYRFALEDTFTLSEPPWRVRTRLAAALVAAGRSREAADAYALASREAAREGAAEAGDLERRAAEHYLRGGHIQLGTALLRRVLDASGLRYPRSGTTAIASTVALRSRLWLRGHDFVPRPAERVPAEELARADACWSAGLGCAWIDAMRAASFQARYMLLVLEAGEPSRISLALSTEASQLAALGGVARTD